MSDGTISRQFLKLKPKIQQILWRADIKQHVGKKKKKKIEILVPARFQVITLIWRQLKTKKSSTLKIYICGIYV